MNKLLIEGINGSLELNKKYVYLIINNNESNYEEHIVWFDEIENIVYKKPTRVKYGYISLILLIKGIITNKKKEYKIILDRIDEKSIETNKHVYSFIKGIVENKEVKVLEVVEKNEQLKEEPSKPLEKPTKNYIEEIKKIVKENNIQIASGIYNKKEEKTIEEIKKSEEIKKEVTAQPNNFSSIEKISDNIIQNQDEEYVDIDVLSIEDDLTDYVEEKEEEQEEEKTIKSVYNLERKLYELEKDLQKITYKEIIINDFVDNTMDRKKIDKLIIEIKKLIEKIQKIKKEILKHEKAINEDEYIKLNDGNVTILGMNKSLLEETELNSYIAQYKDVVKRLDNVQKETDELKEKTEEKKEDLGLSNEEYDRMINQFRGVKSNKEYISKLIKETKERLSKVKWRIEKTIEPHVKYKYVKKEISKQTKRLAALTTLNGLRPKRSKLSMIALSLFTGVSSIHDLLGYDLKKVEYNEIIQKEFLEGLEYLETSKARALIDNSKEEIDSILNECEKKYGNYPGFKSLRKNLETLKKSIEEQDKELSLLEEKIYDYNIGPKTKVLRHVA